MFYSGSQKPPQKPKNYNEELKQLTGYLSDKDAKISLAKFFKQNLGITTHLLTGVDLFPIQEIMIKTMFNRDRVLGILGRGGSKTFCTSIFILLYAIFNQGIKIGVLARNFRQARNIMTTIDNFANTPQGALLRECYSGAKSQMIRGSDEWSILFGTTLVKALPMGDGAKIRGERFNVVVLDELLLFPEHIINEVILPFLSSNLDPKRRAELEKEEQELVEKGIITEDQKTYFPNPKLIGLSSASYKFEYLYQIYCDYERLILLDEEERKRKGAETAASYAILHLAHDAMPKGLYNESAIASAKNQLSESQFAREFGGIFTDDSSGYFSTRKLNAVTVEPGHYPLLELRGESNSEYILAIDASFSESESSDHFAMCVCKIDRESDKLFLVHNYAVAGGNHGDHFKYLAYILKYFNIVYVIIDKAGSEFLDMANESVIMKESGLCLSTFEHDFDNEDYNEALKLAKSSYNKTTRKIVHKQYFKPVWIRRANELLASNIDHKRTWFSAVPENDDLKKAQSVQIPINDLNFDPENQDMGPSRILDFIEHQDKLIILTKKECALIEVRTSPNGHQTFDLPVALKKLKGLDRPRKDSYTALLLANYAWKCYMDMENYTPERRASTFTPFFA